MPPEVRGYSVCDHVQEDQDSLDYKSLMQAQDAAQRAHAHKALSWISPTAYNGT